MRAAHVEVSIRFMGVRSVYTPFTFLQNLFETPM